MSHYSFTLRVGGFDVAHENYEDALYEAGCDDALIAVVDGKLLIDFDRAGRSYSVAVEKAIREVQNAGGEVISIDPLDEEPTPERPALK